MKPFLIFLCLLTLLPVSYAQQEQTRVEIYPLGFADAPSTLEMVRKVIGPTGTVTLDELNRRLIVMATDEQHAQLAGVLTQLNVAPKNVRIEVRFNEASTRRHSGAGVTAGGGIVLGSGGTRTTLAVLPRLESTTTVLSSDVTQTLLVMSGREAALRVGESVPYAEWLLDYGFQWGYLQERIAWRDVGASLVVEPTVIGNGPMIQVRLTPELSGLVDGNPYHIRISRVATEVTVQDGQTIQIGGLNKDEDFYSHFLVGFDSGGNQQSLDISLTPSIVSASGL